MDGLHHEPGDRRVLYIAFNVLFWIASWASTIARGYVRSRMLNAVGLDDWAMLACQILYTGHLLFQSMGIYYGMGQHTANLPVGHARTALMDWYVSGIFYIAGTALVKVSIALLLLRFATTRNQVRMLHYFSISCCFIGMGYLINYLNTCHPIAYFWDLGFTSKGTCQNPQVFADVSYLAAAVNFIADVILATVPIYMVSKTSMDSKTRIAVCMLLGLGSLSVVVTIIRIPFIAEMNNWRNDWLYRTTPVVILSTAELGFGLVSANMSTLRPLLQHLPCPAAATGFVAHRSRGDPVTLTRFEQDAGIRLWDGQRWTAADRPRGSHALKSLTGRESIGCMPDLVLFREPADTAVEWKSWAVGGRLEAGGSGKEDGKEDGVVIGDAVLLTEKRTTTGGVSITEPEPVAGTGHSRMPRLSLKRLSAVDWRWSRQ